jgi:hypothetical protein
MTEFLVVVFAFDNTTNAAVLSCRLQKVLFPFAAPDRGGLWSFFCAAAVSATSFFERMGRNLSPRNDVDGDRQT